MKVRLWGCLVAFAVGVGSGIGVCQAPAPAAAKAPADEDLGVVAAERWIGRALILRGFWAANELKYDPAGHPLDAGKVTDWTLAGFDLQKVRRRTDGDLELDGVRVAARWNPDQRLFERHLLKTELLRIDFPAPDAGGVEPALAAMFSVGIDPALQRSMPPYWTHYFIPATPWPADEVTGKTLIALGSKQPEGIVYPQVVKKGEPGFTQEASADHVKGTVRVGIDVDENGLSVRAVVRQPLGYGLDAKTVEAVQKYRFNPGMVHGAPAVVEIVVNQGFD
jgi:TonB family protein